MRLAVPLLVLFSPLTALAVPQEDTGDSAAPLVTTSPAAPAALTAAPPARSALVAPVAPIPSTPTGVAVVALGNSSEEAWPLARAIYSRPKLRPAHLSEDQVRILAGDPADKGAPPSLQELANDRANLGADPSTTALISLGSQLHVAALYIVVGVPSKVAGAKDRARARLFSVSNRSFVGDWRAPHTGLAANIRKDTEDTGWDGAAKSAEASLLEKPSGKPFYASPWFWGALGAAAAIGTTAIIVASTKSTDTLSLRGEVSR